MVFEWKNAAAGLGIVALGVPVYYLIGSGKKTLPEQ
jgi:hypothetical protein